MAFTLIATRVNSGLSPEAAAKKLDISVETLSNWENGKTFPNVPQIKKIEDLYGVTYRDIIFLPENSV